MEISPINEESLLIRLGDTISEDIHHQVKYYSDVLLKLEGVFSVVPSYNSIMVYFDIFELEYSDLKTKIESMAYVMNEQTLKTRIVEIPVCYEIGLDLERVSKHTGLSIKEIISSHSSIDYLIYMIGFTPGFPYLGGLLEVLNTPRLEIPRTKIEAGSVGIGGSQTGIYPLETPGGWNIIGKTPLSLFDKKISKTLLNMGEYIRFIPIDTKTFDRILTEVKEGSYEVVVRTC